METKLRLINEALKVWNEAGRPENETLELMEWLLKKDVEAQLKIMNLRDALRPFATAKTPLNITALNLQSATDAYNAP